MPQSRPPNWDLLRAIVTDALELPPPQREDFVRARAAGDQAVESEALAMVRAYARTDAVIHPTSDAWLGLDGVDLLSLGGQCIGRYVLERLISEGAMSAVYLATQVNPRRPVALKLVRHNLPMVDSAARFLREADALGRIRHPNVARILEAGVHRDVSMGRRAGLPFIAMEFVDGLPITEFVRRNRVPREQRVRLAIKVASAVHAAHQQAVIHRDLKPANVLVDADGEPKVLDFGIARLIGAEETEATLWQTTAGVLLGTPAYMSPEQAAGRVGDIDVRSDVWALGVLLHELLTDRLPIDVGNTSIAQTLRLIELADPAPPSRYDRSLRGDLDVIVLTALAREKDRRYPSAQAMADDLQSVLDYEPISARRPSAGYRFSRFARRHRLGLATATFLAAVVIGAGAMVTVSYLRASRERDRAEIVNEFLRQIIAAVDPQTGDKNIAMLDALATAERRIAATLAGRPQVEADVRSSLGWMYFGLSEYDQAQAQLRRAIELRVAIGQADSPAALADQARLATTLRWQYKPDEAQAVAQAALPVAVRKLGAYHETTLALREAVAGCLADRRKLREAENEYAELTELCRKHLGEEHEQTLATAGSYGNVLFDLGQYAESEAVTRQVLSIRQRLGGGRTLGALTLGQNLATCAAELGRIPQAIEQFRDLTASSSEILGPSHWLTLQIRRNLATNLERVGGGDESARIWNELIERYVDAHGWAHDLTLDACAGYASMLLRDRRFDQAEALVHRALAGSGDALGPDSDWRHRLGIILAGALAGRKQFDEAMPMFHSELARLEAKFGPDHQFTLVAMNNYALALIESGDGEAAARVLEPLLPRVADGKFASFEPGIRRNLGHALMQQRRFPEAETQLSEAWRRSVARGERDNAAKIAALLADLHDATARPESARAWRTASGR